MTVWDKRADTIVHQTEPYNAEPPPHALAAHPLTPVEVFYSRNHGPIPDIDASRWRLRVDGLVEQTLELSLDDLRNRFPEQTMVATLQCAGNRRAALMAVRDIPGQHPWGPGATSTAEWTGGWLADVLAAAGLRADAEHVAFEAPDLAADAEPPQQYGGSVPLDKAMAGDVMLAWAMNGAALPRVHGAPVRVVVPGHIGARSVKWVERITVQAQPSTNYFQATAYRLLPAEPNASGDGSSAGLALGAMPLNSAVLRPGDGSRVPAGRTEIAGYAFVGDGRAVARVDVSLDGGLTWRQAELAEGASRWEWQRWRLTVDLAPGECDIAARAWDTSAATQPESPAQVWNPKGYVNTAWARCRVTAH